MANVPGIPVYKEIGATPAPATPADSARVVIVGAGPVGLAMALDLGRRGHEVVVLTRLDFIAHASKAICFSKRSLDILDRLGVGDPPVAKGVTWNVGKVFWGAGDEPVYQFDMLPVKNQKRPGFINIQQYYVEEYLLDGVEKLPNVEIRWGHHVDGVTPMNDGVELAVTADVGGAYTLQAEWLLACDGSRSKAMSSPSIAFTNGSTFSGRIAAWRSTSQPSWKSRRQTSSGCLCISAERPGLNGGSNQNQRSDGISCFIRTSAMRKLSSKTRPSKSSPSLSRTVERAPSQAISHSALSV